MAAVLLVDSDASVRAVRGALEASGHVVIVADSPAAGEERLREGGIDVVVVEYELAGGIEGFVSALQRLPDPPPFVLVGGTMEAPAGSARLGAAGFVMKPCNPDELSLVLQRMVPEPKAGGSAPPMAVMEEQPTVPVSRNGAITSWPRPRRP